MKVAVIGAGYVGLTTAACFAHLGHNVLCADIDAERVARLKKGEVPILELGLPELIKEGLSAGRLEFVVGNAIRLPIAALEKHPLAQVGLDPAQVPGMNRQSRPGRSGCNAR